MIRTQTWNLEMMDTSHYMAVLRVGNTSNFLVLILLEDNAYE